MTPRPPAWFDRRSLRARLMLTGLVGVAVALAIGAFALFAVLGATLDRSVDENARFSAVQVAQLVDERRLPDPLPVWGTQLVQVVDSSGRVVAASLTADRLVPLLADDELRRALAGAGVEVPGSRAGLSGVLRAVAVSAGPSGQRVSVIAAVPITDLAAGQQRLRVGLLVALPLLVGLLGLSAWRVIGAALRPVEALRAGAERIGAERAVSERVGAEWSGGEGRGGSIDRRLPVPDSGDEISALAVTLNTMLDRLEAARLKQRAFVADAAHELRSPIASIRAQLDVAAHLGEGGSLPADLMPDVARLGALVEDLLLLARAGDDRTALATQPVDVVALLGDLAGRYAGAPVAVAVTPGPPILAVAAPAALDRALANLVDNAVRHARTQVRLTARAGPSSVVIEVRDDGHGIPPADRERVFDRFTRLDEARDRDAGGSGLGLPIVRELVARQGGSVRLCDPEAGPGLVARVTVPAAPASGPAWQGILGPCQPPASG